MLTRLILSILVACLSSAVAVAQSSSGAVLLAEMEKKYAADLLPKALRTPITIEQADAFVAAIRFFRDASKADLPRLEAIDPQGDLRLKQARERLMNWVGREVPLKLDEALQETRRMLEGAVSTGTDYVKFGADIDLQDAHKVRNNFANPDNVALREAAIRDTLVLLNLLVRLDEQLGVKSAWPDKRQEFESLAAKFHEKLAAASAMIVPPKDIGDQELKKIAEATLKDPKYGAKEWKRLIVNSARRKKTYAIYEVRDRTIVRVDYDYDFFQATTIEAEGKDLFLFHNVLAFYRSGATTTPQNQWVVRERFRGARIVPENVNK